MLAFPYYTQANQSPVLVLTDSRPITLKANVEALVPAIRKPNYTTDVLQPLYAAQKVKAAQDAAAAIEAVKQAEEARQVAILKVSRITNISTSFSPASGQLVAGVMGWSSPYGNCVDEARAYGKVQSGNPITWVPTGDTPFLGAAVLFYFNHTAVVSGIYADGSIEVYQQNSPGAPHHYSQSQIRGYF